MSTAATVLSITTNLFLLFEVYRYFKQSGELTDEVIKQKRIIWDLEDKLRKLQDELMKNERIGNRSRKKL
ncbi:hypothetical protein [Bartonella gabonensis]|uniref:hypothetical protein n=1 Tax=Bartonella gabonensis TaxID=2699889 RepID=UPI00158E2B4A|nr:hypothetical protein [Bartonella gabonensis]